MFGKVVPALLGIAGLVGVPAASSEQVVPSSPDVAVIGEALLAAPAVPFGTARTGAPAQLPACEDQSYRLAPWRLTTALTWSYNPADAPDPVASTALSTLQKASQTVASGRNRCGEDAALSTAETYEGTTTRVAQVSPEGTCTGNDGTSVVSWGSLPPSYLAYTCVYYRRSTGAVLSSDMLIDNRVHQWATTLPASCARVFDLESVAVHERGHTAGLDHVDQARSAAQVMSPKQPPCSTTKRVLAAGDLTGLRSLYR